MNTKTLIVSLSAALLMLSLSGQARACYYQGDSGQSYEDYEQTASASGDCYYSGDPVVEANGQIDSAVIASEGTQYYTADLPEGWAFAVAQQQQVQEEAQVQVVTQQQTEISAFEHEQDEQSEFSAFEPQTAAPVKQPEDDLTIRNWTPSSWYEAY